MKVAPWFRGSITVLAEVVLGGCGGSGTPSLVPGTVAPPSVGPTGAAPTVAATLPTPSPRTSTDVFDPHFKFTLPATWSVTDEKVVLIRFLPNGATNDDFDNGRADGIDVIDGIGASTAACGGDFAPKVGLDAASIATELASRPGLEVTKAKASIGGLSGFVLDIRLASSWSKGCPGAGRGP